MTKYVKKPIPVEAIQWFKHGDHPKVLQRMNGSFFIKTLEGFMDVTSGDFIIEGIHGEYYPVKPDIFEKTYCTKLEYPKIAKRYLKEYVKDRSNKIILD